MNHDDYLRLALLVCILLLSPIAIGFRLRSSTGEKLDRWQEGALILFGLRLSAAPPFIGGVMWMLNPKLMAWSTVPIPLWIRWFGFLLVIGGGLLFVWAFRCLGANLTDTVVTRKDHTLVTHGAYRYVRHPFYLAGVIIVIGGGMVTANWFLAASGLVPYSILFFRTRIEEEKLTERFGDKYRDYVAKTGQFFPRLF